MNGSYGIERTQPSTLLGELSEVEWAQFCEQVDDIVVPFNKLEKLIRFCGIVSFFVYAIAGAVLYFFFPDFFYRSDGGNPDTIGLFLAFLIPTFLSIGGIVIANKKRQRGFAEVKSICERISIRHQTLSFHLRAVRSQSQGSRSQGSRSQGFTSQGFTSQGFTSQGFITRAQAHKDPYILVMINRQQQGP